MKNCYRMVMQEIDADGNVVREQVIEIDLRVQRPKMECREYLHEFLEGPDVGRLHEPRRLA